MASNYLLQAVECPIRLFAFALLLCVEPSTPTRLRRTVPLWQRSTSCMPKVSNQANYAFFYTAQPITPLSPTEGRLSPQGRSASPSDQPSLQRRVQFVHRVLPPLTPRKEDWIVTPVPAIFTAAMLHGFSPSSPPCRKLISSRCGKCDFSSPHPLSLRYD
ncbi:uncharacterized protein BDR25DRAFT_361197 [Lindgomyces ingoldianus]|uniref:Uncharacterized protein n=1 Tax=Lindgomyces ingoldianus TaxID=673940 RepID=A0ACB6QFT8_9PLEO|nr:uncharacterized protein BDR25DRAFT_361197 [Lindgomyces ingoldianus]KAF2464977.1 hypothetical protein BDR25DRAFT_361197 [Lindgomyces ingoldianus]